MSRVGRAVWFAVWFTGQLLAANVAVAREILTPGDGLSPAIVWVTLRSRTPVELSSLLAFVTLTPGTLVLAVDRSDGDPRIAVHGMHVGDVAALRAQLTELEDRLLAVLRPARDAGRGTS